MKNINGTWYNVGEISRITFEEFRSINTNFTEDKAKNIYEQITGKKVIKEKPIIEVKKEKKVITEVKAEKVNDDMGLV
jgi:hypothetical protein